MISKIFLLLIAQIVFSSERTQLPEIYDFYVYSKTFIDPIKGPSRCISGDPEQTITLSLKKNFSFKLKDQHSDQFSLDIEEMTGNWHLSSSNMLQLNIQSTEKVFVFKDYDMKGNRLKPTIKHFNSPDTLKLQFSGPILIFENDKKLKQNGKLIKFNKKRMKKIYGGK